MRGGPKEQEVRCSKNYVHRALAEVLLVARHLFSDWEGGGLFCIAVSKPAVVLSIVCMLCRDPTLWSIGS